MRRVGAFDHRRQLRIADSGQLAGGADRAGADTDLDDIGTRQDQFLGHFAGDHVAGQDHQRREVGADARNEGDEALVIAVGDVDADVAHRGTGLLHHAPELVLVGARDAHRVERGRLALELAEKGHRRLDRIVLVQRNRQLEPVERQCHLEGPGGIHVGRDDRDPGVALRRMAKGELARDVDIGARRQRRSLRPDQHVFVIQLDLMLDVHRRAPGQPAQQGRNRVDRKACAPCAIHRYRVIVDLYRARATGHAPAGQPAGAALPWSRIDSAANSSLMVSRRRTSWKRSPSTITSAARGREL